MIRYPAVEACLERRYGRGEDQEATGAAAVVENLDEPPSLIAGQNLAYPIDRNAHGVILAALWFNVRAGAGTEISQAPITGRSFCEPESGHRLGQFGVVSRHAYLRALCCGMIAKTLPGLPPYGDAAKSFPEPNAFREGLVVSFTPTDGDRWVGNFRCGSNSLHGIHEELGEEGILVVAGGEAYLVNAREQRASLEAPCVRSVNFEPGLDMFVIADDYGVTALGKSGVKWRSRRVSWDGIIQLEKKGMSLHGLAYNIDDLPPVPFIIDLETGHASGGSYDQGKLPTKLGSVNWLRYLKQFLGPRAR